jgi:hypothetical protein
MYGNPFLVAFMMQGGRLYDLVDQLFVDTIIMMKE